MRFHALSRLMPDGPQFQIVLLDAEGGLGFRQRKRTSQPLLMGLVGCVVLKSFRTLSVERHDESRLGSGEVGSVAAEVAGV